MTFDESDGQDFWSADEVSGTSRANDKLAINERR
jgi:hypothetical protein